MHDGELEVRGGTGANPYDAPLADVETIVERPLPTRHVNPLSPHWLPTILTAPERFFDPRVRFRRVPTGVVAWLTGIVASLDRLSRAHLTAALSGSETLSYSWAGAWATALSTGLIWALMYYYVGGFWYGLRLRWSGVKAPDGEGVRELNLFSGLPYVLLSALEMAIATGLFASYTDYWHDGWTYTPLVYSAVSLVGVGISYRGARARYGLSSGAGAMWFLFLPGLLLVLGVVTFFLLQQEDVIAYIPQWAAFEL